MSYVCNINVPKSSRMLQDGEGRVVAILSFLCSSYFKNSILLYLKTRDLYEMRNMTGFANVNVKTISQWSSEDKTAAISKVKIRRKS